MKKLFFLNIFLLIFCLFSLAETIPQMDVKVNHLGDAEKFYIIQAIWLPDIKDSLITVFFNSDDKTFWRYVINSYNPSNDVYTTLFEEQENKNFYFKMFFYYKGELGFLKKFINNPFDKKDYVVFCQLKDRKRTIALLKDVNKKIQNKKNMLSKEIKGNLTNCNTLDCIKIDKNKLFLINKVGEKTREELLLENCSNAFIISGTNLILLQRDGDYFIYDINIKKIIYKLNFIESYTKFKVEVINFLDFSPDGKYILFETTSKYKGRNKKSVGILTKPVFN